ncbi:MAG: PIG-L family deacetylase [Ferruginibacter sp.]
MKAIWLGILMIGFFGCSNDRPPVSSQPRKVIMAVFAHPDDEVDVAPLLSRLSAEGHQVYLVIATKGEIGITEHAKIPAGDSLAHVRERETICNCDILGIKPPIMLGMGDASLTRRPALAILHEKLDSVFNAFKPDVVITWGPDGGSGHPDHRMVGNVVTEIFQSGQTSTFGKLFFTGIPTENWLKPPIYLTDLGKEVHETYKTVKKEFLTTRIKCEKPEIEKAINAMYCYKSQYTQAEMSDNRLWTLFMNRDTVYLRPFVFQKEISYNLFD